MRRLKKHLPTIIFTLILILGIGFLCYPTFSDWWNSLHQTRAIMSYVEEVNRIGEEEYARILESARTYNSRISSRGIHWKLSEEEKAEYLSQLDFASNGNMGYITIEKINIMLPIYHGTSEGVLQTSIGHIEGSSLPVGIKEWTIHDGLVDPNEGSHCVLSGHRGLPSAKLFSDLDKLAEGNTFTISVLNETLTYQVDQIRVVDPIDLSNLTIERGMDYCTLVTCTPYGINTHRLLVRGHRVANASGDAKVTADAIKIDTVYVVPFVGVPMLTLLLIIMLIRTRISIKRRKRQKSGEKDSYNNSSPIKPDSWRYLQGKLPEENMPETTDPTETGNNKNPPQAQRKPKAEKPADDPQKNPPERSDQNSPQNDAENN